MRHTMSKGSAANLKPAAISFNFNASEATKKHICSITGKEYVGYGNNAFPFEGRCSDEANSLYVIPARMCGFTPEMIKRYGGNVAFAAIMDKSRTR